MGSCTSAGKMSNANILAAKGGSPNDDGLISRVVNDYIARNGSTNGIESLRITSIVDKGGSSFNTFDNTFGALTQSTHGNLIVDTARTNFSSDGKTYYAVISNRQMTDDTRDFVEKLKKKK